jgi:hypothetical protein
MLIFLVARNYVTVNTRIHAPALFYEIFTVGFYNLLKSHWFLSSSEMWHRILKCNLEAFLKNFRPWKWKQEDWPQRRWINTGPLDVTSEKVIIFIFPAMRVLVSRGEWFFYNSDIQFIILLQHVNLEVEIVVSICLMGCLPFTLYVKMRMQFMRVSVFYYLFLQQSWKSMIYSISFTPICSVRKGYCYTVWRQWTTPDHVPRVFKLCKLFLFLFLYRAFW